MREARGTEPGWGISRDLRRVAASPLGEGVSGFLELACLHRFSSYYSTGASQCYQKMLRTEICSLEVENKCDYRSLSGKGIDSCIVLGQLS